MLYIYWKKFVPLFTVALFTGLVHCQPSNPIEPKDGSNSSKQNVTKVGDKGSVTLAFLPNSTNIFASFSKSTMKALPDRFSKGRAMKLIDVDMINQPFLDNALSQVKNLDPTSLDDAGKNMQNLLKMNPSTANLDGTPLATLMTLADFTGIGGGAASLLAEMLGVSASQEFISIDILKETIADNLLTRHPEVGSDGKMTVYLSDALSDMATLVRLAQSDTDGNGVDDNTGLTIEMEDENGNPQVDCYDENGDVALDKSSGIAVLVDECQADFLNELTPNVDSDGYHDTAISYSSDTGKCEARFWAAEICRGVPLDPPGESGPPYNDEISELCNILYRNPADTVTVGAPIDEAIIEMWCDDSDQDDEPNCVDVRSDDYDKSTNKRYQLMGTFDRNEDCLADRYAGVLAPTFVQVDEDADGVDDVTNEDITFPGQGDIESSGQVGYGFDDTSLSYSNTCSTSSYLRGFCLTIDSSNTTYWGLCQPLLTNNGVDATETEIDDLGTEFCDNETLNPNCSAGLPQGKFDTNEGFLYYLPMGTKDDEPKGTPDCYPDTYPALLRGLPESAIMDDDFRMSMPARVNATAQQGFDFSRRERANKDSLNTENIDLYVTADEDPSGVGLQIFGLKDVTTIDISFAMAEYANYQYGDKTNPACTKESASDDLDDDRCLGRDSFIGLEYDQRRYNDEAGATYDPPSQTDCDPEISNDNNCLAIYYQTDYGDPDPADAAGSHLDGQWTVATNFPNGPTAGNHIHPGHGTTVSVIGAETDLSGNLKWNNEVAELDQPGWHDTSQGKVNYRYMGKNRIWRELGPFTLEYIILDAAYRAYGNLVYYGLGHPFRSLDNTFNLPASTNYGNDFTAEEDFSSIGGAGWCHPLDWNDEIFNPYRYISGSQTDGTICFDDPVNTLSMTYEPIQNLNSLLWLDYDYRTFASGYGDFTGFAPGDSGCDFTGGLTTEQELSCIDTWPESRGFHKAYLSGTNLAAEVWVGASNFNKWGPEDFNDKEDYDTNHNPQYDGGDWVRVKRNYLLSDPDLNFYMHDLVSMVAQIRMHDTNATLTATYECTIKEDGSVDAACDMVDDPDDPDGAVERWVAFYGFTHDGTFTTTGDSSIGVVRGISQVEVTKIEVDSGSGFVELTDGDNYKVATSLDEDRGLRIEFCTADPASQTESQYKTAWCDATRIESRLREDDVIRITYDYVDRLNEGEAKVNFELNDIDLGLSQEEIQQSVLETISSPDGKNALLEIADGLFTNASGKPDLYMDREYAGAGEYDYFIRYYYPDGDPDNIVVADELSKYEGVTVGFFEDEELTTPMNMQAGDTCTVTDDCMSFRISKDGGEVFYMMDTEGWVYKITLQPQPAGVETSFDWERVK